MRFRKNLLPDPLATRIAVLRPCVSICELHEADELEREEKRQRSLSGRISRLLGRVGSP